MERMWKIVVDNWPKLLEGLGVTLEMTMIAVVIGFVIGVVLRSQECTETSFSTEFRPQS